MNITDLDQRVKAGYGFFYLKTYEPNRIKGMIQDKFGETWKVLNWNLEDQSTGAPNDPDKIIDALSTPKNMVVAENWYWFLGDPGQGIDKFKVTQLKNRKELIQSKSGRAVLIILGQIDFESAIPEDLQRDFLCLEFDLPNKDELAVPYSNLCTAIKAKNPEIAVDGFDKDTILDSLKGLTLSEAENALALVAVQNKGMLNAKSVGRIRSQIFESIPGLKLYEPNGGFETIRGYDNIKSFVKLSLSSKRANESKGIMLLGPPGTGKTMFAKAVAGEFEKLLFSLELAEMFGSLVGETEKNVRKALDIIKANAPCYVILDKHLVQFKSL